MSKTLSKILEIPQALFLGNPSLGQTLRDVSPSIEADLRLATETLGTLRRAYDTFRVKECKALGINAYPIPLKLNQYDWEYYKKNLSNKVCSIALKTQGFRGLASQDLDQAKTQRSQLLHARGELNNLIESLQKGTKNWRFNVEVGQVEVLADRALVELKSRKPKLENIEQWIQELKEHYKSDSQYTEVLSKMVFMRRLYYLKAASTALGEAYTQIVSLPPDDPSDNLSKALQLIQQSEPGNSTSTFTSST